MYIVVTLGDELLAKNELLANKNLTSEIPLKTGKQCFLLFPYNSPNAFLCFFVNTTEINAKV